METYGNVKIIEGKFSSKFPYCRSIFIDDKIKGIIDPGSGKEQYLEILNKNRIKYVFNTHYHYDHIHYNYLFYRSKIMMNEKEAECFINRINIPKRVGVYEALGEKAVNEWLHYTQQINAKKTPYSPSRNHAWYLSTSRLSGIYQYEDRWQCGETEFEFVHTPGHSEGFCCVLFPDQELICTGDIDLTPFGPWYGGTDSDIDDFIRSSKKILNLELKHYATGHEIGTLSNNEFAEKLEQYLDIINRRDIKILNVLEETGPLNIDQITQLGLIYGGPKYVVDPWIYAWEKVTLYKHLKRLEKTRKVKIKNSMFEIA